MVEAGITNAKLASNMIRVRALRIFIDSPRRKNSVYRQSYRHPHKPHRAAEVAAGTEVLARREVAGNDLSLAKE